MEKIILKMDICFYFYILLDLYFIKIDYIDDENIKYKDSFSMKIEEFPFVIFRPDPPVDIDYINAHGTSTKYNDLYETRAIKMCFSEHAYKLKVNSTKSMTGHLLGAAGGIEFVVLCKSVQEGFVHQTINYRTPDPDCDLDYVTKCGINMPVKYAMSNAFGFGGHNAAIIIKRRDC